jgi:hypothetical protein
VVERGNHRGNNLENNELSADFRGGFFAAEGKTKSAIRRWQCRKQFASFPGDEFFGKHLGG